MTDIDLLLRGFRADQPGPESAPAAVAAAAKTARGPRRRQFRRRLLAGAGVTATVAGTAVLLFLALPGGGDDRSADVPGGYAAVATVRVSAEGGVTDAVMARAEQIIRARAGAQGVTGVEVTRGADTLTVRVPGSAGLERIRLLAGDPGVRIVDVTDAPDVPTAPVVVPPAGIAGLTLAGDRFRVELANRVEGGLPDALARRRSLALTVTRDGGEVVLGRVDVAASETLSSNALLVRPADEDPDAPGRWVRLLAGGGLAAEFTVDDVRTEGVVPPGVVAVPEEVLGAFDTALGEGMTAPGSIRPVINGVLQGRRVTEWAGAAMTGGGEPVSVLEIDGGVVAVGGDADTCPATGLFSTFRVCDRGANGAVAYIRGEARDSRIARIEALRAGVAHRVLRGAGRFVAVLPPGAGVVTVRAVDARGRVVGRERVTFTDPSVPPTPSP